MSGRASVLDLERLRIVAGFELAESLRSRLVAIVLVACGLGAAALAYFVTSAIQAAEEAVRQSALARFNAHEVGESELVQRAVQPFLKWFVEDDALSEELARVDPLALSYGFAASSLVGILVLTVSGSAPSDELSRGSTRFVFLRCDRLSWSLGKLVGHAGLLAAGLLMGGIVTLVVASLRGSFDFAGLTWMLRISLCVWVYGLCHLAIFFGISMWGRRPARSGPACVAALFGLWLGHGACSRASATDLSRALAWLFPAQYKLRLWSPDALVSGSAALALLAIGALVFAAGHWSLRGGDA